MLYIKLFIEREKIQVNLRRSVPLSYCVIARVAAGYTGFCVRNLVSLAIFYILPVIQLVITYQSVSVCLCLFLPI